MKESKILHENSGYWVSNEGTKKDPNFHVWVPNGTHCICDSAYKEFELSVYRCDYLVNLNNKKMEEKKEFKEIYVEASLKVDIKGWIKESVRLVHVAIMSTGRYCIYKQVNHYNEESGYKVYDSIQDMEQDFNLIKGIVQVN